MKSKFLAIALGVAVLFGAASCSKDDSTDKAVRVNISGKITNGSTLKAVADQEVLLIKDGSIQTTRTDKNGLYSFNELVSGNAVIAVKRAGFLATSNSLNNIAGVSELGQLAYDQSYNCNFTLDTLSSTLSTTLSFTGDGLSKVAAKSIDVRIRVSDNYYGYVIDTLVKTDATGKLTCPNLPLNSSVTLQVNYASGDYWTKGDYDIVSVAAKDADPEYSINISYKNSALVLVSSNLLNDFGQSTKVFEVGGDITLAFSLSVDTSNWRIGKAEYYTESYNSSVSGNSPIKRPFTLKASNSEDNDTIKIVVTDLKNITIKSKNALKKNTEYKFTIGSMYSSDLQNYYSGQTITFKTKE